MNVIVLGGGVAGVTTAYYLLEDGHEVTLIERQPRVARECSHANGGFVAISQRYPGRPPRRADQYLQDHGAARRADPDPPSPLPRIWRWGLGFLRASRRGPSWANTRHGLRLSLHGFEALTEIRAATGVSVRRRHPRRPQGLFEPERTSMTSPPSSRMSSAAPFITLRAFGPGARPSDG